MHKFYISINIILALKNNLRLFNEKQSCIYILENTRLQNPV